jgi:acetoacetyl-CoA synthetase
MSQILWMPDATRCERTHLQRFTDRLCADTGAKIAGFEDLHAFSVAEPAMFWRQLWTYAGVVGDMGEPPFVVDSEKMPGARFFPSAQLNFAENALQRRGNEPVLVFRGEDRIRRTTSADELRLRVAQLQGFLKEAGVAPGDRVAAVLPNCPEAIVGALAAASIGAVWSSCSPDFGVQGILDRFGQIEPKVLITCDGYYYGGKTIDVAPKVIEVSGALASLAGVVIVPYLGRAGELAQRLGATSGARSLRAVTWGEAVEARPATEPVFERLAFDHPLYILFSSGTTGVPKCIVHRAGGILLKHLSEHLLHTDVQHGDRLFYFTTLGWMMWNWLVSGLTAGATLLLYDGSPFHPSGNVLWDYAADERCTQFGTSAKYIDALAKSGLEPARTHDLAPLRAVMSTGSPLSPESFDYIYRAIKGDVHLASISGGTDICGCFVLGNPTKPVVRGEIQSPALGLAVDVADESGAPLVHGKGELVCRNAFPSMPLGFWNDADGSRYRAAYFTRFPGLWHHGDFAEWTVTGGMIIHGRSDATLNPGGVRIGTAEIYRQVEQLAEVQESIVIGQDWQGDVRVVLFVVLRPGAVLDEALEKRIRTKIRDGASPRHVPARIVAVRDIPRTKSGKITELAVRDVVMGREVKNKEALANPEALDLYRGLPALNS